MKRHQNRYVIFAVGVFACWLCASCVTVKRNNKNIYALWTETELQKDVDFLHKKLQKLHPNLYWYISKEALDYKFDSLKSTLTTPMTSNEFYYRISPVLASIRQGHNMIVPLVEKIPRKELKLYKGKGTNPLLQFKYELFDEKLYIVKNNSADTTIRIGAEIVAINGITPQEIYKNHLPSFASDGYNKTHFPHLFANSFSVFYQFQNVKPLLDSVLYRLKYNDTITEHWVCQTKKDTAENLSFWKKLTTDTTDKKRLTYLETDSSIALMSIPRFSEIVQFSFYKKSFEQLKNANTQTLIIDLRDNPGGAVRDIRELFSYLTDTSFYLMDKAEVTSRTSLLQPNDVFKNKSVVGSVLAVIFYPFKLISMGVTFSKVSQEEDGKYYYSLNGTKLKPHNPSYFKGDVYVLINGGSFSASSVISSNLHGSKRAVFVGEETGGAYNGCVAGTFYKYTLPKSKLKGKFGLITTKPFYQTEADGRGVMPDIEVIPTIEDRIAGTDPELNAILELLRGR